MKNICQRKNIYTGRLKEHFIDLTLIFIFGVFFRHPVKFPAHLSMTMAANFQSDSMSFSSSIAFNLLVMYFISFNIH